MSHGHLIPDAEEVPSACPPYTLAPAAHSLSTTIPPNNYSSQYQPYPTPQMIQQSNYMSRTVPQPMPSSFQYTQQLAMSQTLPAFTGSQAVTMPLYSLPVPMGGQIDQRDEFDSLIQEIINELSKDSKVMEELRFVFSEKFTQEELDKIPDVQSFIIRLMEKGFLSENNVVYLEDYLRETSYDHLTKKLQKFSQSSDSAVRSVQPSVAKQGQSPQRVEERPVSLPQSQPYSQPQQNYPFPRPPSEAAIYYYPMDKRPHGICAIFNIQHFTAETLGRRKGSDIDRDRLRYMFTFLKYELHVYNDLSAGQLMSTLEEISQWDHSNYDSFICCILTHGSDNDTLYGSDGIEINIRSIMSLFYGNKAKSLFGKPKIFFIQACRGDLEDKGTEDKPFEKKKNILLEDSQQVSSDYYFDSVDLPDTADFLIAFPTSSGYVSWRSHNEGTWYIKALCEQLEQCHEQYDLMTILTMVNGQVALKKTTDGYKQMPAPVTHLRKLVYIKS